MPIASLKDRIDTLVWTPARDTGLVRLARTVLILGRDLAFGQLTLRAMGLVYTTLLSIVPLLALSFSVLKAFGVTNQIQPMLLNLLAPLGEKGGEIALRITGFIANMNVGVLGAVGLALLLYTSVSLIQKIEESLNFIWHAPRARPLGERFTRYLTVLMVGPILVFSALGATATVMNIELVRGLMEVDVLSQLAQALSRLVPYLLITAAFTFIYLFMPNTRVRLLPALVGGAVGGIAWQTAGWAFALFIASSNNYAAIYASFAILILFMIWLYLSWLVLLFGASVAFYLQHPEYLYMRGGEPRLSNRMRELLALSIMERVARSFMHGEAAPSQDALTQHLKVPGHVLMVVLDALERKELVVATADEPCGYLPSRSPDRIPLAEVLEAVRAADEDGFLSPSAVPTPAAVDGLLMQLQQASATALAGKSLHDLVRQDAAAQVAPSPPAPA
ncbi:YhjD/YihY/BrkB family envelope integrity protein [Hydrogenophaga sp.]|uniref:YhjD/YihY/BrkB family envelope integrity protein n=1 Tax=Hydrogenophaga sp. TaxID=1904254 RepID=UPI003D0A32DC